jgi:hypothetical protein
MKTKETTRTHASGRLQGRPWPPSRREGAQERKKGPGGRRKVLITLDSDKENKVNSFDFLWPGFAG